MNGSKDGVGGKAAILREYSRVAGRYDQRWSYYVNTTVQETIRRINLEPSDRVLDVGCGTGALLHALSHSFPAARLVGLDASAEMLALARRKLGPVAELSQGWAEEMPFQSGSFDLVASCSVFHYIHDPMAALREMRRVLRPKGRLIITDWCDDYLACRVCDLYLRFFDPAHFRVYRERECRELLAASGFTTVETERFKINWLWGLMTAKGRKSR